MWSIRKLNAYCVILGILNILWNIRKLLIHDVLLSIRKLKTYYCGVLGNIMHIVKRNHRSDGRCNLWVMLH